MNLVKTNITNIGDPFVLTDNGVYYMYATSSSNGFCVWSGTDLDNLQPQGLCYLAQNSFGINCFWAPEVVRRADGKYVMFFTARDARLDSLRVGVALADSPLGPFVDIADNPLLNDGATIDASCFIDDDGKAYLYYVKDCWENVVDGIHVSQIYVVRLDDTLTKVISHPVLVAQPTEPWENKPYPAPLVCELDDWLQKDERVYFLWNEGPFVCKKDGLYYLTYSANCFDSRYYGVGLATSNSPTGPFVKQSKPLLQVNDGQTCGTGHSMFFDVNGQTMMAFHCHTDYSKPNGNRRFCYCKVQIADGKITIL